LRFPFVVIPELSDAQITRYRCHIDSEASGWHRKWTESIWRRHQHPSNARLSGWTGPEDQRRRIVHFYDEYDLVGRSFVLRNAYLWLHLSLPEEQIEGYQALIETGLRGGDWRADGVEHARGLRQQRYRRGDLVLRIAHAAVHPEDQKRERRLPAGYRSLELWLETDGYRVPSGWHERPWRVFFDVGLRPTSPRGEPELVEPERLSELLPAQLELGCGPSIAAGVPHLSNLHRIYGVSLPDYGFIFDARHDGLLSLIGDPELKYREMTAIYRACVVAEQTECYRVMADLWRRGWLVGPVITNNFDCQCADLGLDEISLRRYDWGPYYPRIDYDPRARSLLVVGVHADRRLVQMRARARGLRVAYIDPERYAAPDGHVIDYPVEAPQSGDSFVRMTAESAFPRLHAALAGRVPPT
jgi:hypothetical protein